MKVFLQSHWKLVLGTNLLFGISLWFGFFTDVSLRGTIPDILFPPAVATFAWMTIGAIPTLKRKLAKLAYIPSCIGGCLYLLMGFVTLIPPFTLAFLFGASEIASEVRIQQAISPNKVHLAEVYFRPVGAYSGGNGRIYIRVINRLLPFVERDIYYLRVSHANEDSQNYVQWKDDDTLYITETDEQIKIDHVRSELPIMAMVPLMIAGLAQSQVKESQQTAPLNDIPVYPGRRENESNSYWDVQDTAERIYFLPQGQVEEVYDWYRTTLSKAPWEVVDLQIVSNSDPAYEGYDTHIYCFTAVKHDDNQTMVYYFEIAELHGLLEPDYEFIDPNVWDVRVIVATPNPDSIYCW